MVDASDIATWIGIAASGAIVVTVVLLVRQLREAQRTARLNQAVAMLERLTSPGFAERRWKMHQSVAKHAANGWAGFDDTLEDFEARSFSYQYELLGQMVLGKRKEIDYELVRDFLQLSVAADWQAFEPLNAHLLERFGSDVKEWDHFRQLATRIANELGHPDMIPGSPQWVPREHGPSR